jgi:hypothetical protein
MNDNDIVTVIRILKKYKPQIEFNMYTEIVTEFAQAFKHKKDFNYFDFMKDCCD